MRILLVTLSDLLLPSFKNSLSFENDYCAIVVDDPNPVKKVLVPAGCSEDMFFPLYDLKECIKKFYHDVLLCVTDGRCVALRDYCYKSGATQKKFLQLNAMNTALNFFVERTLRYYKEHSGEFEIFSTGDSRIEKGMDSGQFGGKLFNFGRGSQDLYYDYQSAKFALTTGGGKGKIKYALIGLNAPSFHYDESKSSTLTLGLLQYFIAFGDVHNFWLPADKYKSLLKEDFLNFKLGFENFDVNNIYYEKMKGNMNFLTRMEEREQADAWNDKNYPETREENIKILDDYLTLCEENNVTPIIFLPPMPEGYKKHFSEQMLDEFHYLVNEAIKKHPGAKFFDGWQLPGFTDEFFADSIHLNVRGAAKFSAIFNDVIRKLKKKSA